MLILLSPAKTINADINRSVSIKSFPRFLDESSELMKKLKSKSPGQLSKLMDINSDLAQLNAERNANWKRDYTEKEAEPALLYFGGEVFRGLDAASLSEKELQFAQNHLRILSGLYGSLKPLDYILPYRLEMGTKLKMTSKIANLYQFWGDKISWSLKEDLKQQNNKVIVNLSSNEYYKAVKPSLLDARIITPRFMDNKNGSYKSIMTYAKNARGMMARYLIQNAITKPEELLGFNQGGYGFNPALSHEDSPVFTRG